MGRIEIVRDLVGVMNTDGLEALFDGLPESFEFTPDPSFPESGTYSGAELRAWGLAWDAAWEVAILEVLEMHEEGAAVLARSRWRVKGAASGVEVPFEEFTMIIWFEDETPARGAAFFENDRALAAVRNPPPPA
jgi:hypothetical protein